MYTVFPPILGVCLSLFMLFLLSKKHNVKWLIVAFVIYYIVAFAYNGDFTMTGSFVINALALIVVAPFSFFPYLLYGLYYDKFDSFFFTLIFPISYICIEFIIPVLRISPGMNPCYFFFHVTPLIQCASLIGAAGLTFILAWFYASLITMITKKFAVKYIVSASVSLALVLAALIFGFIRLANADEPDRFVKTAWVTGPEIKCIDGVWERLPYMTNVDSFKNSAKTAYESGAEFLIFTEEAFSVEGEKTDAFLSMVCETAKEYALPMLVGFDLDTADGNRENVIYYINRDGEVVDRYVKHMVIPLVEAGYVIGANEVHSNSDTFGCGPVKMAYTICYDGNFEVFVQQMINDADFYLYPSWDWEAVEKTHTMIAGFRAVENGVTLAKPTFDGQSTLYDAYGRIIYKTNTDDGFEKVYTFDMPCNNKVTFYEKFATVEDIVVLVGAAALFTYAFIYGYRRRKKN